MSYFDALLYGLVQGITEYLPVSSSAHLILLPRFLKTEDPGLAFDVFLHLGTLISTLGFFWKDWRSIARSFPNRKADVGSVDWKLIVVATLPALVAGAVLHKFISSAFRGNVVLAVTLPLGGILLYFSDRFQKKSEAMSSLTLRDAFKIGCFQCLALVPGMSRSGSTMMGGRVLGLSREASARFSFLISAPITAAAIVFELRHYHELLNGPVGMDSLLIAFLATAFFGVVTIRFLLKLLKRFGFLSFLVYRLILAGVILFYLGT